MTNVSKFYLSVINDVIINVKDDFSEEGVEEQVLHELKKVWEQKLSETRALEHDNERHSSIPATQYSQLLFRGHPTNNSQIVNANSVAVGQTIKQQTYQPVSLGQIQRGQVITGAAQAAQAAAAMTVPTVYQSHGQGVSRGVVTLTGPLVNGSTAFQPRHGAMEERHQPLVYPQPIHLPPGLRRPVPIQPHPPRLTMPPSNPYDRQPTAAGGHQYIAVPTGQILTHASVPTMTVSGPNPQASGSLAGQTGVPNQLQTFKQMDGVNGSSSEDDDEEDDEDEFTTLGAAGGPSTTLTMEGEDDEDDLLGSGEGDEGSGGPKEEDEPLNSGDDVSDEETEQLFDTDNVVVCQYDKITRCRNRWKFHLKDGIMTISGKDHVFQKAVGDAEW